MLEMVDAALARRRSPSDADSSSKEKSEASSEAAAFVLMSEDIAEESENEPEAAEDDDEVQLSRRRRGKTGESEAALANAFIILFFRYNLIVKNMSNAITKNKDTNDLCDVFSLCGGILSVRH